MTELENAIKLVRENVEWTDYSKRHPPGGDDLDTRFHSNYAGFIKSEPEIFVNIGIKESLSKSGEPYNRGVCPFYCYLTFSSKERSELKRFEEAGKLEEIGELYALLKDANFTSLILSNIKLREEMYFKAQRDRKDATLKRLESLLV